MSEPNNNQRQQKPNSSKSRVDDQHGGELVEEIRSENIVLMNDPNCTHERMLRDETETDFLAFQCANPKCGIVKLIDK